MGGAAGHMMHIYDNGELTWKEVTNMLIDIVCNKVKLYEKTDGFNIHATVKDKKVYFARNKTTAKNPIPKEDLPSMFKEAHVKKIFFDAAEALEQALSAFNITDMDDWFINCEILNPECNRMINYQPSIQIHHMTKFDETGTVIETKPFRYVFYQNSEITVHGPNRLVLRDVNTELIMSIMDFYKMETPQHPDDTLNTYYGYRLCLLIHQKYGIDISPAIDEILDRWIMRNTSNMKAIKAKLSEEAGKAFTQIDKRDRYKLTRIAKFNIEQSLTNIFTKILRALSESRDNDLKSITSKEDYAKKIQEIKQFLVDNPDDISEEHKLLFDHLDLTDQAPFEGVVFQYSGRTYKMTGAYSVLNHVLDFKNRKELKESTS